MFDFNGTLIIVFVSFFIYMLIMKPLFFDRLMAVLGERDLVISTAENKANDVAEKFKQLEIETQQKLSAAHQNAQSTIKDATNQARLQASEMKSKAEEKAKSHITHVVTTLHESTQQCYDQLAPQKNEWAQSILSRLKQANNKEACRLS